MNNKMDHKEPRWQRRKSVRPQEIIGAALELFVQQGYSATRVEQVARRAGVTPGTLYVYFENKEALLKAVVHESIDPVLASANRQLTEFRGSARDMIRELIRKWWSEVGQGRFAGIPKLIIAEAQNYPELARFYVTEVQERTREIVRRILAYGLQTGEFAVPDIESAARLILAPLQFMSIHTHSLAVFETQHPDPETYLSEFAELILNGLCKR